MGGQTPDGSQSQGDPPRLRPEGGGSSFALPSRHVAEASHGGPPLVSPGKDRQPLGEEYPG